MLTDRANIQIISTVIQHRLITGVYVISKKEMEAFFWIILGHMCAGLTQLANGG